MRNTEDGRTLNTRVYDTLRGHIIGGMLLPGQRLKVANLAAEHQVSPNVVREALNRLAGERLVEVQPQFGFAVRELSADDLNDLVDMRVMIESEALRRSIARGDVAWQSEVLAAHHRLSRAPLTVPGAPDALNPDWRSRHDEFNFAMLKACGSRRLFQMVRQLAEAAELYHRALLPQTGKQRPLEAEHAELLAAILDGDAKRAIAVLTAHLEATRDVMLPLLLAPPAPAPRQTAPKRRQAVVQRTAKAAPKTQKAAPKKPLSLRGRAIKRVS
ncbi:MAG: putative regulatory protein [Betaproteobacteria bacterium]|nr:putative regulatory protein [Betaproteobacteria bacterium]